MVEPIKMIFKQIIKAAPISSRIRGSWRSLSVASEAGPKVCVVGAGPAGFYATQHIVKTLPTATVDIIEKLPVPFGLVR